MEGKAAPRIERTPIAVETKGSVTTGARQTTYSKQFARRLCKGTGADPCASGAVRVAGTDNCKRKYGPEFPTVSSVSAFPSRIVTPEQLEELGLLAAPEPVEAAPFRVSTSRSWPDHQRCVEGAPRNRGDTGPDISSADNFFCLLSAQRGHGVEEIAARLMEESEQTRESGKQYRSSPVSVCLTEHK